MALGCRLASHRAIYVAISAWSAFSQLGHEVWQTVANELEVEPQWARLTLGQFIARCVQPLAGSGIIFFESRQAFVILGEQGVTVLNLELVVSAERVSQAVARCRSVCALAM